MAGLRVEKHTYSGKQGALLQELDEGSCAFLGAAGGLSTKNLLLSTLLDVAVLRVIHACRTWIGERMERMWHAFDHAVLNKRIHCQWCVILVSAKR